MGADARHVHLDAVGGVAGDMFAAALLDAFPDLRPRVLADVAAVLPDHLGAARLTPGSSAGLSVLRFGLPQAERHNHHHHDHDHRSGRFRDIVARIEAAALHDGTSRQAAAILRVLAEAESRMHHVPVEDVHFHEIADWDSVMDVVAAGSIAAALDGATWSVSDLPRGSGLVRTQHGLLPVPAPATVEILAGFRWRDDGIAGERVTPTGAAILRHLVAPGVSAQAAGILHTTGTGAGTRDLPGLPNILRALVFTSGRAHETTDVTVLCFDVDDMTGEEIGVAADRLRAADGVLDLSLGVRIGKKGRPLHDFTLLLRPDALVSVRDLCFAETTTIGARWRQEQRVCLPRRASLRVEAGRDMRLKHATRPDGTETAKVESDDLQPIDTLARRRAMQAMLDRDRE